MAYSIEIARPSGASAELIAILLRVGVQGENAVQVGQRLINTFHGLSGLHRASFAEVCDQRGIGEAKAAQIKATIELGRRLAAEAPKERPAVHSPQDAAEHARYEMNALEQEELRVLLLDNRNRLLAIERQVMSLAFLLSTTDSRAVSKAMQVHRSARIVHNW